MESKGSVRMFFLTTLWVHHMGIHTVEYSLSIHLATTVHKRATDL